MRGWLVVGLLGCGGSSGKPIDAPVIDDAPPDAPQCMPVGTPTMVGGSIATATEWTEAGSPYHLPSDLTITAALTIDPCVIVIIDGGHSINVRPGGSIIAKGEVGRVVRFARANDATAWASITASGPNQLSFEHTQIDGGGNPLNTLPVYAAAIELAATTGPAQPVLHALDLAISNSASNGIYLHQGAGFEATSSDVRITTSAGFPIHASERVMGTIPPGTYTGNTNDLILITASAGTEAVQEDETMHARGVPYKIGVQPNVTLNVQGATGVAKLTIEPGVTLAFNTGVTMTIDPAQTTSAARGALIAVGTAAQPIVFTSVEYPPSAGDWHGIWFGGAVDAATRMDFTTVAYAGGLDQNGSASCIPTGQVGPNDAAIRILGGTEPSSVFITNTTIMDSARHGIDRGFRSATKPSFIPTNTFTNIAGCKESYPEDLNNGCPATIPCP